MARFTGFDEVFSALYVDFDNIYTRFLEIDPEAARAFGSVPYRWVRWIENHALRILYGEGVRRRILKRMCYLNPQRYQEYRNPFIRSAFQVVDCPPLTTRGKTSTDIHLVMDCMDDLSHSTHFDEFIILSGDADFTPLLIRLQEHARRTLVLSVGYSSPAYTAAASWRIREDWFLQQALRDERTDDVDDQPVPVPHTPPLTASAPAASASSAPVSAITPTPSAARGHQAAPAAPAAPAIDEEDEGPSPGNAW
ncbi:NYN domain-containing protein [Desulfovibrio sp.]|uniref:NYN domain-containing protein n=1 Tax=Desulfovibrio sp. TaxID=885 RepID=UPI0035B0225C